MLHAACMEIMMLKAHVFLEMSCLASFRVKLVLIERS